MDIDESFYGKKRLREEDDINNESNKKQNVTQYKGIKRKFDDIDLDEEPNFKINTTNAVRPSLDVLRGRRDAYYTQKFNSEKGGKLTRRKKRKSRKKGIRRSIRKTRT
jgi:hypothetical protein